MNGRYVVPCLTGACRRRVAEAAEEFQIQGAEQSVRHKTNERRREERDEKCGSVREPLLPK